MIVTSPSTDNRRKTAFVIFAQTLLPEPYTRCYYLTDIC